MKMELLATLCIGVGWIIGITVSMIFVPIGNGVDYDFLEAMGNILVFGFPGFVMFIISLILSIKDNANDGNY